MPQAMHSPLARRDLGCGHVGGVDVRGLEVSGLLRLGVSLGMDGFGESEGTGGEVSDEIGGAVRRGGVSNRVSIS